MLKRIKIINEVTNEVLVMSANSRETWAVSNGFSTDFHEVETDWRGKYFLQGYAPERVYTQADYDNAMENHITATRLARGYTVREPSSYINSSNARWAQDAQDWIAFVDEVMEYGLTALNAQTAPSFEDFKNNLPVITWSDVADENTGGNSE